MSEQSPWSVKNVDAETRERLKHQAQRHGLTLGAYFKVLSQGHVAVSYRLWALAVGGLALALWAHGGLG